MVKTIEAPVAAGQELGELRLHFADELVLSAPLVALQEAKEADMFSRLLDGAQLLFRDLFGVD